MTEYIAEIIAKLNQEAYFKYKQITHSSALSFQGHCNTNYLLHTAREKYILRVFGSENRDRSAEYRIQHAASRQHLAAKPLFLDLEAGLMVSEYVYGTHIHSLSNKNIQALSRVLFSLHSLPPPKKNILHNAEPQGLPGFGYDPVLCHHDLNPYNILWKSDTPMLIDWEYAGINDRYFDLASATVEFKLDKQMCLLLLESYFDDHREIDIKKLRVYQTHYQDLCEQWWQEKRSLQVDS